MKLRDILTPSLRRLREQLGQPKEHKGLVEACRADDSDFCREVVASGQLTKEQMEHAAMKYRLGKSKSGKCIFWMIDEQGQVRDGHVGDGWVSVMMKAREPKLLRDWHADHCLFGLHLLGSEELRIKNEESILNEERRMKNEESRPAVCVVESERSAVILSELFPDCIWLATVYAVNANVFSLRCLRGREATLFPSTDETMDNYLSWCELADEAQRKYGLHITVSDILEQHATAEQRERKIDIADYIFATLNNKYQITNNK